MFKKLKRWQAEKRRANVIFNTPYITGQRYLLALMINNTRYVRLGRFRRFSDAKREADRLNGNGSYTAEVVDTRKHAIAVYRPVPPVLNTDFEEGGADEHPATKT